METLLVPSLLVCHNRHHLFILTLLHDDTDSTDHFSLRIDFICFINILENHRFSTFIDFILLFLVPLHKSYILFQMLLILLIQIFLQGMVFLTLIKVFHLLLCLYQSFFAELLIRRQQGGGHIKMVQGISQEERCESRLIGIVRVQAETVLSQ